MDDEAYRGREQSQIKHRVLEEYARSWGFKLGSTARRGAKKLWYVDCFAGPWGSRDAAGEDTSVAIGLRTLREVAGYWRKQAANVGLGAIFVEKDPKAFERLRALVEKRGAGLDTRVIQGTFEEAVPEIDRVIGNDAALLFVDPKGWKGVGLSAIAKLAKPRYRDVIVNVMFNFVNRFKGDERSFLREQMAELFHVDDPSVLAGLDEDELMAFYRARLKSEAKLPIAADLAVPHPLQDRTWFRLVVGAHHRGALALFRDVERTVCGGEAGEIREHASRRREEAKSGQISLGLDSAREDRWYLELHERDVARLRGLVLVRAQRALRFESLWTELLQELHVSVQDVWNAARGLEKEGVLAIDGAGPRGGMKPNALLRRRS